VHHETVHRGRGRGKAAEYLENTPKITGHGSRTSLSIARWSARSRAQVHTHTHREREQRVDERKTRTKGEAILRASAGSSLTAFTDCSRPLCSL